MAANGDAADLVRDAGCGAVSEPENTQALADAILALMEIPVEGRTTMVENRAGGYRKKLSLPVGGESARISSAQRNDINAFFYYDNLFFKDLRCQNAYSILWPP